MDQHISEKNCILIVDDDFINRELLKNIFSSHYTFEEATNGREGLLQIERHEDKLCAIILDVQMPEMNGIELLGILSERGITERIPTFLITAQDDDALVSTAYGLGVMDVLSKPVAPIVIQKRVKTVVELFSAREALSETVRGQEKKLSENARAIEDLNRGTIEALATAIEFRDIESGEHVSRIYGMTKYILLHTAFGDGLSDEAIESIARGSILHDVGKIAISDVILNKPGRLSREEFEVMKQHTVKGAVLLEKIEQIQSADTYRYACDIARHHHERWDGHGYPDGLKGDEISIAAQVVSIVDVYDALVSVRVYKKAYTPDEAVHMICAGECGVFNPRLVECFLQAEPAIRRWYAEGGAGGMMEALSEDTNRINPLHNVREQIEKNSISDSVMEVMLLMTAVKTAYDMIISVNLSKNTFSMIDYDRFRTHCADYDGAFDDLIEAGCSSIPVSHRREFHDTFCRQSLLRAFREGKKSVRLEHPQYSDDGTLHWVATKVLFMEDGRSGDILQITLSNYIDDEISTREKTRKILSDALNLAEQANVARYEFLSKMSHNIRTPLNAIVGMTTIIASHLHDPDKISSCLVKIGTSSRYLLGIVNDVLDYTKIENGAMILSMADFNLRDMIADLEGQLNESVQAKGQITRVVVDDLVANSYVGDEFRIKQILLNLLDNASRYTPAGGSCSLHVGVSYHAGDHDVLTFTVEDNGIGIRAEFLPRLFEPFAQEESADTVENIGLGLPIARNLAHLMNGDIGVVSEPGKGSRFTLEIPLERGNLTAYSETIDTDIHVLVVDDEPDVCEYTALLLHNMGIVVETADNGFDALHLMEKNIGTEKEFDVAIVDWKMPVMDGVETVRRIRRIVGPDVLVVIMSAYDWTDIEAEAREAGVDLFIAKPILETSLRTAIACSEKILRDKTDIAFDGERVLIAEDNEFNAEVAKAILEMKNLSVDVAPDGKVAYEMFTSAPAGTYIAILMDILMPVMDGHEATRAIRASAHPEAGSIPIYAMTANAFRTDILEAKLSGMNAHIAKPVDFNEVARMLQAVIKKKQTEKQDMGGNNHG